MSFTIVIILVVVGIGGFYVYLKFKKAKSEEISPEPKKVKPENYIICPSCGERMIVDSDE